jgi:hypothetical protein
MQANGTGITPELQHLLEELYETKEDLFLDEAQGSLQHYSAVPVGIESVRREMALLKMSNKMVRKLPFIPLPCPEFPTSMGLC